MLEFYAGFDPETHLLAFVLGSARLMTFAIVAPFMGNAALNGTVRSALILALYLVIHPAVLSEMPGFMPLAGERLLDYVLLMLKEVFIGFVLGWLAGMAFWSIESAGIFIDNQRGASAANSTDPLSGSASSPTGSFLFQSAAYAFFSSGCFPACLMIIYGTYELWPVTAFIPSDFFLKEGAAEFFGGALAKLALDAVLISAPVVLACLFTDIALGLINRFASQLNVYILAMPIKCALASFLLIFYFAVLMNDAPERFAQFGLDLKALEVWLP